MAAVPRTPPRPSRAARAPRTPDHSRDPVTPRHRKLNANQRLPGIQTNLPPSLSLPSIRQRLTKEFQLSYEPDDWQCHLLQKILQRYDSVFCAGTGYGKSIIFEGLALLGGTGKLVIVICPLKALERDQAAQACAKGLDAIAINKDTEKTTALWKQLRTSAQLVYMSPEMALGDSFSSLWKDPKFHTRLTAMVVDEAHCIDEWGTDKFRPLYRQLHTLRGYTGQEVPFVACTATCQTSTFETIWTSLGFGTRPFWGLDVGCDRANLLFVTRELENTKNPVLDVLNLLPANLGPDTKLTDIDKGVFYFESESACRLGVQTIRKALPAHLRSAVHAFSSDLSEKAKQQCWEQFTSGEYRIICATDAAGMGCNVADVKNVVVFGCPRAFAAVAQHWGRSGRDRETLAVCLLLVPPWAFRDK
ncbi:P-loop containing nucleoside triphosphate hydrolase protein, partial [Mycena floridula]